MSNGLPDRVQARRTVDWTQVHRRLQEARDALDQFGEPPPEQAREILKARARALAREPRGSEPAEATLEIVEFLLAHESYAIESRCVREVCPLRELTPLPGTPSFILGITAVRGQILSVIDLKRFFDLPERGLTDLNKIIIVHSEAIVIGILADSLLGVRSLPSQELQPPLATWTGVRAEYLKGVTRERLVVLDAARILSDERILLSHPVEKSV